jgi:hypothetical protein
MLKVCSMFIGHWKTVNILHVDKPGDGDWNVCHSAEPLTCCAAYCQKPKSYITMLMSDLERQKRLTCYHALFITHQVLRYLGMYFGDCCPVRTFVYFLQQMLILLYYLPVASISSLYVVINHSLYPTPVSVWAFPFFVRWHCWHVSTVSCINVSQSLLLV